MTQNVPVTARFLRPFVCLAACLAVAPWAGAAGEESQLPSFEELEAAGAKVGEIRIDARNIFELDDPREDNRFYRAFNFLHVTTRPSVIQRTLLFKPGEPVKKQLIDETERILRSYKYIYDVDIRPAAYHDGVVDIDVTTRDTWTLDLVVTFSHSGGANSSRVGFSEYNLLGTAATLGVFQTSNPDRHGTQFQFTYPQAFDNWTQFAYTEGRFNDGDNQVASISRPFYALDTRWAAGANWLRNNRIDSIYNAGDVVSKFRHLTEGEQASGGWSPGLIDGWTQRFSGGVSVQDDHYSMVPGEVSPAPFPVNHDVRGPFLLYELVEDRFVRMRNHDQIGRTEFVQLGMDLQAQVTQASTAWGSTKSAWLYSMNLTDGLTLPWDHDLLASAVAERTVGSTGEPFSHQGFSLRYYAAQGAHTAFYGLVAGDRLSDAAAPDQLQLGGDTGLRGYPLRYQEGDKRALFTVEERYYTDWYPFRLFRVGAAAFYDRGRAWGGVNQNTVNGGWLSDAGVGLRLSLDRTFARVLHMDIAVPLDRVEGIKGVQYLVRTEASF
jgi:hypothetical protein